MNPKNLRLRLRRLFENAKGIDRILIVNTGSKDPNFTYFTDFEGLFEDSFLLIEKYKATVFTDMREYEGAKRMESSSLKVVKLDSKKKYNLITNSVKNRVVGINGAYLPYRSFIRIKKTMKPKKLVDLSEAFSATRMVKDSEEISRIRKANAITKKAISESIKRLRVGVTEKEMASVFENTIQKLGAEGSAFSYSIVSFGSNCAIPHHAPDGTKLRYGDFVLMDVGARYRSYCSDVTRTIIFGGKKDRIKDYERKKEIINIVDKAQRLAIAAIKEGAIGNDIHMIAQDYLNKAANGKYKNTMGHSLGHSIGLEVHDGLGRFLSPNSKLVLKEGMVSSVEPGIYISGFGGARKEDDIVVTKKGALIL